MSKCTVRKCKSRMQSDTFARGADNGLISLRALVNGNTGRGERWKRDARCPRPALALSALRNRERIHLGRKRFITIEWPALSADAPSLYARGLSEPLWCHRRETRRLRASKLNRARAFARAFHPHRSHLLPIQRGDRKE